mmetsp:Transcript_19163/g.29352  ORF Transcript_19163/g.29352 Transcript_19163/m.29352 type:complete len:169 (+) Transcript_19163:200-706(+)
MQNETERVLSTDFEQGDYFKKKERTRQHPLNQQPVSKKSTSRHKPQPPLDRKYSLKNQSKGSKTSIALNKVSGSNKTSQAVLNPSSPNTAQGQARQSSPFGMMKSQKGFKNGVKHSHKKQHEAGDDLGLSDEEKNEPQFQLQAQSFEGGTSREEKGRKKLLIAGSHHS